MIALLLTLGLAQFERVPIAQSPDAGPRPNGKAALEALESCGVCHGQERLELERGVHARAGIDCTTCHGGVGGTTDAAAAHGEDLRALREPQDALASCGSCHSDLERMRLYGLRTDQIALYHTSQHGVELARNPEADVATCVSCHGAHAVFRHTDSRSPIHRRNQVETCGSCHSDPERMGPYGLDTDVATNYRESIHGRALLVDEHAAAPACTDCHGAHGAQPPGVAEVEMVCGQCHSVVQQHYERSAHFTGALANGTVQCASCHDNHGIHSPSAEMFLGDAEGHCGSCHEDDRGAEAALRLHDQVETFAATIDAAEDEIRLAGSRGLFMEEETGYVDESRALLVRARALTHAAQPDLLVDVLSRGDAMVERTLESLEIKQRGSRDVRIITALFFAVAIAFAIVLLMYARMLRGGWKPARGGAAGGGSGGR